MFTAMDNILVNTNLRGVREIGVEGLLKKEERERRYGWRVKRSFGERVERKNQTERMTSGLVWALDSFPDGL